MANTIQLKLLENKSIIAEFNGKNYAYEGGYRIVAGSKGDTYFEIVSIPPQYANYTMDISMTNAQGYEVPKSSIKIENNKRFNLPEEMAVAGYGSISIKAVKNGTEAIWMPLKVKIWNNDYKQSPLAPALIKIGTTNTVAAGNSAKVTNSGSDKYVVLDFQIPQGKDGIVAPSAGMFFIGMDNNGTIYCDYTDQGEVPQFEYNQKTGEIYYIIGE